MYYVLVMKNSNGERNWIVSAKQLVNYIKSIKNNCNAVKIYIDARCNKKDASLMATCHKTVEFDKNYPEICLDYISKEESLMSIYERFNIDPAVPRKYAIQRKAKDLYNWLDNLYWWLPDNMYNILESPVGFDELLSMVDNDKYKSIY